MDGAPLEIVADREADATLVLTIAETAKVAGIERVKLITLRGGG